MLDAIEKSFQKKSTEELFALYEEHDFDEWSEEAFVVMKKLLEARGETVADLNSFDKKSFISKDAHYTEAANSAQHTGAAIKVIAIVGFVIVSLIALSATKNGTALSMNILSNGLIATGVYGTGCILSSLGMLLKKSNKKPSK